MLSIHPKRRRRQRQGKQVGLVEGKDGKRLRIMKYKLPEPDYHTPDCAPRNLTHIDLEHLTMLLWQLAVDAGWWKRALEFMDPGVVQMVQGDFDVGANWQGFGGHRLESLATLDAADGILPMLMRAPFIDNDDDLAKFLGHWSEPQGRRRMAVYARHIPLPRPTKKDEDALLVMLREFGLQLRPSAPEDGSQAFHELAELLRMSSGLFSNKKQKLPTWSDLQEERDRKQDGGCGCGAT